MLYHRDMGYQTTVQLISRERTEQWYVNFPAAIARGMDFKKGEVVEWTIDSKEQLTLKRKIQKKEITDEPSGEAKNA